MYRYTVPTYWQHGEAVATTTAYVGSAFGLNPLTLSNMPGRNCLRGRVSVILGLSHVTGCGVMQIQSGKLVFEVIQLIPDFGHLVYSVIWLSANFPELTDSLTNWDESHVAVVTLAK